MKAPAFWWTKKTFAAFLLSPLGALYGWITSLRMRRNGTKVSKPVICVGNFVAGGAGKTPVALTLAALLKEMGEAPVFLSRGYGGRHHGPARVDLLNHGPDDVGDEPLLLAQNAPTVIARDRVAGAQLAAEQGSVIIMDDGMQNGALHKDLIFAVIDSGQGLGNGLCVPAGPLRAPFQDQARVIDYCISIGGEAPENVRSYVKDRLLRATLVPDETQAQALRGQKVFAFCGIGHPAKFEQSLRACGVTVAGQRAFPDHHLFSRVEIEQLLAEARRRDALPITTTKDIVRVAAAAPDLVDKVAVLPVRLVFDDEARVKAILREICSAA